MRLQKVLAAAGVASRRASEELIEQGRVTVDGQVVRVQGMRVHPDRARIEVDGERVSVDPTHVYVMLNKPAGYVTTANDPKGRRTVLELVRSKRRLFPVGRLDMDTLGLLLLTDDGELTHRLTHPRYEIKRGYLVEVAGDVPPAAIKRLVDGVDLDDGPAAALAARAVARTRSRTQIELTLTEGRNREVRRMIEAIGFEVRQLVRTRFGPLRLGDLPTGASRPLTPKEVGALLSAVGL